MVTENKFKSSEVITIVGESDSGKMTYAVIHFHGSISFMDLKNIFHLLRHVFGW